MKTRHAIVAKIASLLFVIAGAVNTQIVTHTYNDTGNGYGALGDIGFDSWNQFFGYPASYDYATFDGGFISSSTYWDDFAGNTTIGTRANVRFDAPVTPPGHTLVKAEMSLYMISVSGSTPTSSRTYHLFDQMGGWNSGNVIDTFTVVDSEDETWKTFEIPLSLLGGGFSMGWDPVISDSNHRYFSAYGEGYSDAMLRPQVTFTYLVDPVPEPSAVLLGSLGLLPLLRRRRG